MSDGVAVSGRYSENQTALQADVPVKGALAIIYIPKDKAGTLLPISGDVSEFDRDMSALKEMVRKMQGSKTSFSDFNVTIVSKDDRTTNEVVNSLRENGVNPSITNQDESIKLYLKNGNFVQEHKQDLEQQDKGLEIN